MIGSLRGKVIHFQPPKMIVETAAGVGYEVVSTALVQENENILLFTSHVIKETDQELYGFKNYKEKNLFELLITVTGVGPKSAFSLMSCVGYQDIVDAILLENPGVLKKASGVGAKASEQIILDLKKKIKDLSSASTFLPQGEKTSGGTSLVRESLEAFEQLGFSQEKVMPFIKQALESKLEKSSDIVKVVLKQLRQ
jgi:Holliday junction DNA helicase RuvA